MHAGVVPVSLSASVLERCAHVVRIPTSFCVNVAMAGAIVMYDRATTLGRFAPRPLRPGGAAPAACPRQDQAAGLSGLAPDLELARSDGTAFGPVSKVVIPDAAKRLLHRPGRSKAKNRGPACRNLCRISPAVPGPARSSEDGATVRDTAGAHVGRRYSNFRPISEVQPSSSLSKPRSTAFFSSLPTSVTAATRSLRRGSSPTNLRCQTLFFHELDSGSKPKISGFTM